VSTWRTGNQSGQETQPLFVSPCVQDSTISFWLPPPGVLGGTPVSLALVVLFLISDRSISVHSYQSFHSLASSKWFLRALPVLLRSTPVENHITITRPRGPDHDHGQTFPVPVPAQVPRIHVLIFVQWKFPTWSVHGSAAFKLLSMVRNDLSDLRRDMRVRAEHESRLYPALIKFSSSGGQLSTWCPLRRAIMQRA
jgi:hypothetical protein